MIYFQSRAKGGIDALLCNSFVADAKGKNLTNGVEGKCFARGCTNFLQRRRFPARSAGIVQSGGDSVDGRAQRIVQRLRVISEAFSAKQVHLNQAHRIHIRIPQADGA